MKTVKRIVAVLLLIITILVVGYLVYTGSRLTEIQEEPTITEVVYEIATNTKY